MKTEVFSASDERILKMGRYTLDNGLPAFCWPNSGIRFTFRGSSFIINFLPFKQTYTHYILVKMGRFSQRFPISTGNEKIIIENVPTGLHNVEVLKVTEGEGIDERIVISSIAVRGISPALAEPQFPLYRYKLEFVGDSLTAGYGNLGSADDKKFYTYQQDSSRSYAAVCADILNAEAHYICYSGKGIYCNCNGVKDYEIPTFFTHASRVTHEPWDFSRWAPDAVIVNAGTNDFAGKVDGEKFKDAVVDFLKQIRATYPKALIVWAYGMTQSVATQYLERAFNEFDDDNSHLLILTSMYEYKSEFGANGHPNVRSAKRQGAVVARFLKEQLR